MQQQGRYGGCRNALYPPVLIDCRDSLQSDSSGCFRAPAGACHWLRLSSEGTGESGRAPVG